MDVDLGAIWAADFDNVIRFHARRPARRLRVTLRENKNSKDLTDVSLWVSILGFFGSLVLIMSLDFTSAALPTGEGSPVGTTKFLKVKDVTL